MNLHDVTVLLTGAGGAAGLALARQLRTRGARTFGVDMAPLAADLRAEYDEFVLCPAATDPALVPFLRELVHGLRPALFIPTVQEELPVIAAAGELGASVVVSAPASVSIAHDKLLTAQALQDAGVPVPRFKAATTTRLTDDDVKDLGLPLIVKPRVSRGGRGVRVVEDPSDAEPLVVGESILQEFAPGTEYVAQVFVPRNGGRASAYILEKTRLKEGRVGNAAAVRRTRNQECPDVAQVALAAVRALGLQGPVDIDVRRSETGVPLVLEINARFGANSEHVPELLGHVLTERLVEQEADCVR